LIQTPRSRPPGTERQIAGKPSWSPAPSLRSPVMKPWPACEHGSLGDLFASSGSRTGCR